MEIKRVVNNTIIKKDPSETFIRVAVISGELKFNGRDALPETLYYFTDDVNVNGYGVYKVM